MSEKSARGQCPADTLSGAGYTEHGYVSPPGTDLVTYLLGDSRVLELALAADRLIGGI